MAIVIKQQLSVTTGNGSWARIRSPQRRSRIHLPWSMWHLLWRRTWSLSVFALVGLSWSICEVFGEKSRQSIPFVFLGKQFVHSREAMSCAWRAQIHSSLHTLGCLLTRMRRV
jgi:hypothetical protein